MGDLYGYKCNKCGFEHNYHLGCGFGSDNYNKETERLCNELKEDSTSGKYGPIIKAILDTNHGDIFFSCETELFQCQDCKALLVHRDKYIGLWQRPTNQYELDINFKQACPECGSMNFKKADKYFPICPKCKEDFLELSTFGNWD